MSTGCATDWAVPEMPRAKQRSGFFAPLHRGTQHWQVPAQGVGVRRCAISGPAFRPRPSDQGRLGDMCVREDLHTILCIGPALGVSPRHQPALNNAAFIVCYQFDRYLRTPKRSVRAQCSASNEQQP
jgi:hypothetical protein